MSERAEHSGQDCRGNSSDLERRPENTGAQAEGRRMRRKKIKMEENDMHRSEERVLEVDKNIVCTMSLI